MERKVYSYFYKCPECGKEIEVKKKELIKKVRTTHEIYYEDDYAYIILKYNDTDYKVLFDKEDSKKINKVKWRLQNSSRSNKPYLQARGRDKTTKKMWLMQRYILDMPDFDYKEVIDHINRNSLDNRKSNLRIVSQWENLQNKPQENNKVSGVYWLKERQLYLAEICFKKKRHRLGFYKEYKEAVIARQAAEQVYRSLA